VNYKDGDPKTGSLRTVHGYTISSKRYVLLERSEIVEVKGHGLGYLMSPASEDEPDWMKTAWEYVLRFDHVLCGHDEDSRVVTSFAWTLERLRKTVRLCSRSHPAYRCA